jgi:glutaredoxin
VVQDPDRMEEMLKLSGGQRKVPVIEDGGKIVVGYGGT